MWFCRLLGLSQGVEELRLYRRIATLDASAPLPPLEDQSPLWAEASALLSRWGMNQVADRLAARVEQPSTS